MAKKTETVEVQPVAGKEPRKQPKLPEQKPLSKAQALALEALDFAQSLDELAAAMAALTPSERNDKRVGFPVYQATQRIVGRIIPLA